MNAIQQSFVIRNWMIFLLLAVCGLFYVKWFPYYQRALNAAATHSIGQSILLGAEARSPEPSLAAALDYAWRYGRAIWQAMVLGLLLGSAVQVLLPARWIVRVLGHTGFGSVAAGGLLAIPGMMCTCCAAPVVAGLREQKASPGGALAFWLGNTMLNPATLVFMAFVLGWHWAVLRLVLGALMVFGLGALANRLSRLSRPAVPDGALAAPLAGQIAQIEAHAAGLAGHVFVRWMGLCARMTWRLVPEYLVLILLLGASRAWLFPHFGPEVTNHLGWILGLAVAGMLFVIPTAGEVPIVQAMLSLGMSVGPAAALLLTLPPVSVPSLVMLARSFAPGLLLLVASVVVGFGLIAAGLAIVLGF
ncbi:permease [Paraburkholderia bonniea]|uniref:permease n=1 Tax=Paraburkholderia bonniea TaxID=2152891 RepID=UPI002572C60A|nr:permease [Paraburkholderia bonniea]WJF88928.1 permease [Paraburkholderia bonniea]WJF92244.1 permease [Paraburkholderia bonniea]